MVNTYNVATQIVMLRVCLYYVPTSFALKLLLKKNKILICYDSLYKVKYTLIAFEVKKTNLH